MNDNIMIENIEFTQEIYQKALEENSFTENNLHGIGDDTDGNS